MKFRSCMAHTNTTFCLHNLAYDISRLRRKGVRANETVMVLRELKLLAAALYVGRQGVIPGGLALGTAWSVQLPPPWPNWRQPQPCNCLQLCCGPEHTYSHRWASLRTGVATQCPSYMWEKAIAACNCRPAPISLSQRSPI